MRDVSTLEHKLKRNNDCARISNGVKIPQTTISRLSFILREAKRLQDESRDFISSQALSNRLGYSDAQIRRDLNYFGHFGISGKGYDVAQLRKTLSRILGIGSKQWPVALVGVGNLGSALLSYKGFREQGFIINAAFDKSPDKIGKTMAGIKILGANKISSTVRDNNIKIGIVAVPPEDAQFVADELVAGGVSAILNFAPAKIQAPAKINLRNVDLSCELEALSYYLSHK